MNKQVFIDLLKNHLGLFVSIIQSPLNEQVLFEQPALIWASVGGFKESLENIGCRQIQQLIFQLEKFSLSDRASVVKEIQAYREYYQLQMLHASFVVQYIKTTRPIVFEVFPHDVELSFLQVVDQVEKGLEVSCDREEAFNGSIMVDHPVMVSSARTLERQISADVRALEEEFRISTFGIVSPSPLEKTSVAPLKRKPAQKAKRYRHENTKSSSIQKESSTNRHLVEDVDSVGHLFKRERKLFPEYDDWVRYKIRAQRPVAPTIFTPLMHYPFFLRWPVASKDFDFITPRVPTRSIHIPRTAPKNCHVGSEVIPSTESVPGSDSAVSLSSTTLKLVDQPVVKDEYTQLVEKQTQLKMNQEKRGLFSNELKELNRINEKITEIEAARISHASMNDPAM